MTVLVVDDEPAIRHIVRRALESEGAAVLEAESGDAALDLIEHHPESLDLVVTDLVMPGISGLVMAGVLSVFLPELPVLAMSGHAMLPQPDRRLPLLNKPFTLPQLLAAVAAVRTRPRRAVGQAEEQRILARQLRAAATAAQARATATRSEPVDLLAMARLLQASQRN